MRNFKMNRFARLTICGVLAVCAAPAFQKLKSQKEFDAYKAMMTATTPDATIAAAENLLTTFADTELKPLALYMEADAYGRKGEFEKAVVFGERSLEADPKNYQAQLLLARQYAGHTGENDLDKEEKLGKATKYANDAIASIAAAAKPNPQITDAQWDGAKKSFTAEAHEALGMIADVRKKYDVAANEYKTALDTQPTPDPATLVRYGMAQERQGKYDEAIASFDKALADPNAAGAVKTVATNEKAKATAAKAAKK
jgi:tetratricopeptide (TPR) repeat protein